MFEGGREGGAGVRAEGLQADRESGWTGRTSGFSGRANGVVRGGMHLLAWRDMVWQIHTLNVVYPRDRIRVIVSLRLRLGVGMRIRVKGMLAVRVMGSLPLR